MTGTTTHADADRLQTLLEEPDASVRLKVALAAGTRPHPTYVSVLVRRCAVEPDFYVRDMLTWALTCHDHDAVVALLLPELSVSEPQARSQALHTLSKVGDRRAWPSITTDLLLDADDEVARTAWRTAVALVPDGEENALAEVLVSQLGRGEREVQRSLSRALLALGEVAVPLIKGASSHPDEAVRVHASVTERLFRDPESDWDLAVDEARREIALLNAPKPEE